LARHGGSSHRQQHSRPADLVMRPTRRTGAFGKFRVCISVAAVINLAACQAGPALFGAPGVQRAGDLEFGAHADVKAGYPDTLDVRVAVVNRGTQPVVASWGGCAMRIRLYPPRPAIRPVWDSHSSPTGSGGRTICPAILREQRIEAGDSLPPRDVID
jgi:hypothetical protein